MDKATLQRYLAKAEERVVLGEEHIARQRAVLARLAGDGHDTTRAEELLRTYEESQALHVADRDRLAVELARGSRL